MFPYIRLLAQLSRIQYKLPVFSIKPIFISFLSCFQTIKKRNWMKDFMDCQYLITDFQLSIWKHDIKKVIPRVNYQVYDQHTHTFWDTRKHTVFFSHLNKFLNVEKKSHLLLMMYRDIYHRVFSWLRCCYCDIQT